MTNQRLHRRVQGDLAVAARSLSLGGHDDFNQGQVSARLPGSESMLIKAAVVGFNEAVPDDMIEAPIQVGGGETPKLAPPELPLHQAIYQARPDVRAIVHSHATHTLIFGATDLAIKAVSHDGAYFVGRLERFQLTSDTVLSLDVGEAVAQALTDNPAVLLRNHGGVIVGKAIRHAVVHAHNLERACRLQLMAEQCGVRYHESKPEDVASKRGFVFDDLSIRSYWDHCQRQVAAIWPQSMEWVA